MENKLFEWNDNFSCNSRIIDEQHKVLIDLINKLFAAMKLGKSRFVMNEILEELIKYTIYHFNTEESFYIEKDNDFVIEHIKEHKNFAEQVTSFKNEFDAGNTEVSVELLRFLRTWITKHILGFDKKSNIYFN